MSNRIRTVASSAALAIMIAVASSSLAAQAASAPAGAPATDQKAIQPAAQSPASVVTTDAKTPAGPDAEAATARSEVKAPAAAAVDLKLAPITAPHLVADQSAQATGHDQNVAMMIAGGAALLIGAVIGGQAGQLIAIAGAVFGLVGLFYYTQEN